MANRIQMQQVLENQSQNLQSMFQNTVDAQREATDVNQRMVAQSFLSSHNLDAQSPPVVQQQMPERVSEEIVIHDSTVSDAVHEASPMIQ